MSGTEVKPKSGTEGSGNTIPRPPKKNRGYCMTIYNKEERNILMKMDYRYIIIGKETCPTTGRRHYQCYIYFKNPISFNNLKSQLPTANMRIAKGTAKQNQKYCSKEKIYFEDGEIPHQGKKITIDELKNMTNEEIIEIDARCHKAYIHARDLLNNDIDIDEWKKKVKIIYIFGPSGCGKTEKAKEIVRNKKDKYGSKVNIIKYENSFYSGCGNARIAIYDDWRDSHMKPSEFINLIDYNVHNMNIKGGCVQNKYELIIITTIQNIKDIYKNMNDEEPRKQWERRLKIIELK